MTCAPRPACSRAANVAETHIRIISDVHYGDRASAVHAIDQLDPLLEGTDLLVLNGDTGDIRPGPYPEHTEAVQTTFQAWEQRHPAKVRFISGNHDPYISHQHSVDFAGGAVFVTHGDLLFDDIVPWGNDAAMAAAWVQDGRQALGNGPHHLQQLLEVHRQAAWKIPQRHQSERHGLKYLAGFLRDTVWPLDRTFRILRAWREAPRRAETLLDHHRPEARFLIIGHIHRPGIWRLSRDRVLINTGSFCPPSGPLLVELAAGQLRVRRIRRRSGSFHPGKVVAQFALTRDAKAVTPRP